MRWALLLLVAGAAQAQELPFDGTSIDVCTGMAADAAQAQACIGAAAQACIDSPDGYTTVGMGMCYGMELDHWDARLNVAYKALMKLHEKSDASMKEYGATVPETAPALRDMQRAWIAYRDAACAYERSLWGGGTGQGPATAECLMRMTADQALMLEARVAQETQQ